MEEKKNQDRKQKGESRPAQKERKKRGRGAKAGQNIIGNEPWQKEIKKTIEANLRVQKTRLQTYNKLNLNTNAKVKITPLGGLGEIGGNITVIETDKEAILVDIGMSFPDEEMHGVDILVPDFTYLREIKDKIKAVIITHAHEDHIGAIPYILSYVNVPVYASDFTINILKEKLYDFRLSDIALHTVSPNQSLNIEEFKIKFIRMSHSIIGMLGMLIDTDVARIFMTGDFKIDYPGYTDGMDFFSIAKMGEEGIDILLSDSTNILSAGFSGTEVDVKKSLSDIFLQTKGKVLVAHNAEFDITFLNAHLIKNGYPEIKNTVIDTMKLS